MIFWIIVLAFIYLVWLLLFKGFLWKLILFFGGWVGIYVLLRTNFPDSAHTAITLAGGTYSWAAVIPTVICILALAHTES
jgi:hypothetical protein